MRWILAFPLSVFLAASLLAEEELPQDPNEALDIEPPLLIQEIPNRGPQSSTPEIAPDVDPERIQLALEKAKKSAAAGERLFKSGVIAKLDAENRSMKVVRLETELAEAQLESAKQAVVALEGRFEAGEVSQSELDAAKAAELQATSTAQAAEAKRDRAELDAALLNLRRQKKLLAVGSGRKSEVSRAEEKVATLQQKN